MAPIGLVSMTCSVYLQAYTEVAHWMMIFWMPLDIATGRIRSLQAEALEIAKDIADIQGMVRSRKREQTAE